MCVIENIQSGCILFSRILLKKITVELLLLIIMSVIYYIVGI